jgi:hypothetical protein
VVCFAVYASWCVLQAEPLCIHGLGPMSGGCGSSFGGRWNAILKVYLVQHHPVVPVMSGITCVQAEFFADMEALGGGSGHELCRLSVWDT